MRNIFSLLALLIITSCSTTKEKPAEVIVSIPPYLYFVEALTGGQVTAISLVPPEANPHLFEPTPKLLEQAKYAKIWIRLTESFEKKIAQALEEQNKNLTTLNLADSAEIPYLYEGHSHCCSHHEHEHQSETKDLHIWLSLNLGSIQARLIAEKLIEVFPEKKLLIEKNLKILQERFSQINNAFTEKLSPYRGNAILVSHSAFGYFCRDYGLKQISIEVEGKDPLPQQLNSILSQAEKTKIRTVFTQTQYNNKGAELIAKQLHLPVHEIDPYSSNYLQNLETIVQCIVEP